MVHEESDGIDVVQVEGLLDALSKVQVEDDRADVLLVDREILDPDMELRLVDVDMLVDEVIKVQESGGHLLQVTLKFGQGLEGDFVTLLVGV